MHGLAIADAVGSCPNRNSLNHLSMFGVDYRYRSVGNVRDIQLYATPDGRYVYVASQGTADRPDDRVSVIDVTTNRLAGTVMVGKGAHGVAASTINGISTD